MNPLQHRLPCLWLLCAACTPEEPKSPDAPRIEGTEVGDCSDGADNDSDGLFDCEDDGCAGAPDCEDSDPVALDADDDGYDAVELGGDDCDDSDGAVHPGALEVCNGVDDDCDGETDEGATDAQTFYVDADNDGYGDPEAPIEACSALSGTVAIAGDCDDGVFEINPGRTETCNGVDDDCNELIDDDPADGTTWYADRDGDGFGDLDTPIEACTPPSDAVADAQDCDDTDEEVFPGAVERCNEVDDDCDGATDGWSVPGDFDSIQAGIDGASSGELVCVGPGRWSENLDFSGKDIRVEGVEGSAQTTLLPTYGTPGVLVNKGETTAAVFAGFTFDGSGDLSGGAILIDGAGLTVEDIVCEDIDGEWSESIRGGVVSVVEGELVLLDARFEGNEADFGGREPGEVLGAVMYLDDATATLTDVAFIRNEAYGYSTGNTMSAFGGALYATGSVVRLERVDFEDNDVSVGSDGYSERAGGGAAAFVNGSSLTLLDVRFAANSVHCGATLTPCSSEGGGLYLADSTAVLERVELSENSIQGESSTTSTAHGGALYASGSTLSLDQVSATDNSCAGRAISAGGALAFVSNTTATLTNVVLAANTASSRLGAAQGGAIHAETGRGGLTVTNAELVANAVSAYSTAQGGAIYATTGGVVALTNVGMVENSLSGASLSGSAGHFEDGSSSVGIRYGNVYQNTGADADFAGVSDPTGSAGNISVDPVYLNRSTTLASGWDLRLDSSSACIDAGDPALTDVDGSTSDIGAYGGPGGGW